MTHALVKLLVKKILEHPLDYHWELKGLGMIRTYLNDDTKIHVWDSRYRIPNVSITHEHPWSFESLIVAGCLKQRRLKKIGCVVGAHVFHVSTVQCGPGGRLMSEPDLAYLEPEMEECYHEGQTYSQRFDEIHQSYPEDGTVTIVTRLDYQGEEQPMRAAPVYWPYQTDWISSEPAMATPAKIKDICDASLRRWF